MVDATTDHATHESQMAVVLTEISRDLLGAYNMETRYLRRVRLYAMMVQLKALLRDVMPDAGIVLPPSPDDT